MYLVQHYKQVGFVSTADNTKSTVLRWEPVPSPFGGELRMAGLRAALQYAHEYAARTRIGARVVDANTHVPVAVFTVDTIGYLR